LKKGRILRRKALNLAIFFFFIGGVLAPMATATFTPKRTVTATTEFLGPGSRRPSQTQFTLQQVLEVENLVTDLTHNLQETRSQEDAQQLFRMFLSRLSMYHLYSPHLSMSRFLEKAAHESNRNQQRLNPFTNHFCFLVSYINGPNQDWNIFVLMGIVKWLMQGYPLGAYLLSFGNLKPFHLGQWYTQFAANYSKNESGLLCSLGLFGLKIGNISKADPMVTMERFTGLKITFKIEEVESDHFLRSKQCLYIGFARSIYEGDIPK